MPVGSLASSPFPNGIGAYLLGGLLIGLGTAFVYVTTGIFPGASTVLESTLSYVSTRDRFRRFAGDRRWRALFAIGTVGGAAAFTIASGGGVWVTEVQPWRLGVGGLLVGFGTRLGKGCTSGHGVCGVASRSTASVLNVVVFVGVAIGTAGLVAAAGVVP